MQRQFVQLTRIALIGLMLCLPMSCDTWVMTSAVPTCPVHLTVNTELPYYVSFVPSNVYAYILVDKDGYHYNKQSVLCNATEAYGYAGVVIFIDGLSPYASYDLCCPHCLNPQHPVQVDGIFAECPLCGETYDLTCNAVPTKGIAKEALRRYSTIYSNKIINVYNH